MPDTQLSNEELNARILAAANAAVQTVLEKRNEKPDFVALKYVFVPARGDMGGAFCLIFEGETGDIVHQSLWLTHPYIHKSFKPDRDWRTFLKLFPQLGPYEKVWGDRLNNLLPELVPSEDRIELFEEGDTPVKRHLLHIEGQVRRGFERATQCFFDVSSEVEFLTRSELEKAKILKSLDMSEDDDEIEEADDEEEGDGKKKSFKGTVIQCLACVDPVWGKPSSEIVPGDILEVRIEGDSGPSALVKKFLEETGQASTFPVQQVDRYEDKMYIYLRISDEIQGIMTLTKNLRLKTKQSYVAKKRNKTALEDLFFFALLGIVLVGLLLAVRYFFF
ncbi:MAG: hypothetical protein K6E38_02225 [Fretibacterium sp.]|nr:hypothetical protein [Fretibacterium sp.]